MPGIKYNGDLDDVNSSAYDTVNLPLNNVTETLVTTGTITGRQILFVRNLGPGRVLIGKQGGDKDILFKGQCKSWNFSEDIEIYAIAQSASSPSLFVEEAG